MGALDEYLAALTALPAKERAEVTKHALEATKHLKFIPSPGPQTDAYYSEADVLLYGGEPGGGKSSLLMGLAFNCHSRSLIMRRQYTDLNPLLDEAIKMNGGREGFNGSPPPKLRINKEKIIDFGAAAKIGDEQHFQGNPHDFIGLDEATQFAHSQVTFLMGWLRSVKPGQRTRVVLATNPPLSADGLWVMEMFAPWLAPNHPNPALPGELRWFVTDDMGGDIEVESGESTLVDGKMRTPLSRTYIPASLKDNPFLVGTGYEAKLDNMGEPWRSLLMGGFRTTFRDQDRQVIPTAWVKEAQERWKPKPPSGIPMCAIGVDPAAGGNDETVLAPRYDGYYPDLIVVPGKQTPEGTDVAGLVIKHRRQQAIVIIDMGGGYGMSAFEHLKENKVDVLAHKGSEGVTKRTKDGQYKFYNQRAQVYWQFMEALDPGQPGGSPIMLPDDAKLVADLCAPTFKITPNGILLEPKEDLSKRIGRSPDRGDAVVMAWSAGPTYLTDGVNWDLYNSVEHGGRSGGRRNAVGSNGKRFEPGQVGRRNR